MLAVAAGLAGCREPSAATVAAAPPPDVPYVNGNPMQPVSQVPRDPGRPYVMTVRLTIHRVELPLGTASRSERLWRYFDEEVVDPAVIAVLQRNGFRLGRARTDDWPAVSRVLEELAGAAPGISQALALPGRQQPLVLKEHLGFQRLFVLDRRGLLTGQDYPPGDNVLMMTCHINDQDPTEVIFQAVPVVVSRKKIQRWEHTEQGYRRQEQRVEVPIELLEFSVRAPKGTYLVIGPGADVLRDTSAGRSFLVSERGGLRYETLLVVVPEVFAAPA